LVPVTNVVPKGAQPIHGQVIRIEVIDAVDLQTDTGNWRLKVAVRIRNMRDDRVKCSIRMLFDGEVMEQGWTVEIRKDQTDLALFVAYVGDGKGASQLAKLTAEARDIRIGG
jgi:hypothetical protein